MNQYSITQRPANPRFTPFPQGLVPRRPSLTDLCNSCGFQRDAHAIDPLGGPAICPERGVTGEWGVSAGTHEDRP